MLKCKRVRRLTAWLLMLCVALALIPAPVLAEPASNSVGVTVCVVRRSASTGSTVIGCLPDGASVTVLGTKNGFYRIDCAEMTGYIRTTQVQRDAFGQYYIRCVENASETRVMRVYNESAAASLRSQVRTEALKHRGVPYVYGGSTPRGFDCSGFTQYVLARAGVYINRTCLTQLQNGLIISKAELQCGDLVFFQNTGEDGGFASHVGIYLGDGKLIHAGSKGITVVNLSDSYFTYHYMCARRMIIQQVTPQETPARAPDVGINQGINGSYWRESSRTEESGNSFFAKKGRTERCVLKCKGNYFRLP